MDNHTMTDFNDLHQKGGKEAVLLSFEKNLSQPASIIKTELPEPLVREAEPPTPFPVDALEGVLGSAAKAIADKIQVPLAMAAQSVLSAANLAAQAHVDVVLPTGQPVPCSNYYVTVAASGDRKTASDREAMWPIRKREAELRKQYEEDLEAYQQEAVKASKRTPRSEAEDMGDTPIQAGMGQEAKPPLEPLLICPEPTYEGLCRNYAVGQPSMGIYSSEGGQFIGGHGMSQEKKLMTSAGLSSLWDGDPIRRVRATDGTLFLAGRRLSMHLQMQAKVSSIFLGDDLLIDQGLLSRVLIAAPESLAGTRFWQEPRPESGAAIKKYGGHVLALLQKKPNFAEGKNNELEPRFMDMSRAARAEWIAFSNEKERKLGEKGRWSPISGLANKLPEIAARLAAVLSLVIDAEETCINGVRMEAGVLLAYYYAGEALRLFGHKGIPVEIALAKRLEEWLLAWPLPLVSLPDIYQRGLNAIGDKKKAQQIVSILENHGRLIRMPGTHEVNGKRRKEVWKIVRD